MKKHLLVYPLLILGAFLIPFVCPFISCSSEQQNNANSRYKISQTIQKSYNYEINHEELSFKTYDFDIVTKIYENGDYYDFWTVSVKKSQIDSVKCSEYQKAKEIIKTLEDFYNKKCE